MSEHLDLDLLLLGRPAPEQARAERCSLHICIDRNRSVFFGHGSLLYSRIIGICC